MTALKELLDQIIEDGVMTREEHDHFIEEIHADGVIDEAEQEQISRVFSLIQQGKLIVVDDEREKYEALRREDLKKQMQALQGSGEDD